MKQQLKKFKPDDYMIYSKADLIEMNFNVINSICNELDYLTSHNIEENMVCSLDCCIGNSRTRKTFIEVFENNEEMRSMIGNEGLKLVQQLDEMMEDVCYYDDEKGFSKKQRWLDFVVFANTVNVFLKNAVTKYKINL